MNETVIATIDALLRQRPDIVAAMVSGHGTPAQRHAYKRMQREAKQRATKWQHAER